ncbi:hypothetical protein GvMRE_Ic1g55 [endosymbiont GvMRE of Glomus versiforme]|nr:hypothetical protein GvMRE_Ic1g55 [endosymbiont GvMRE of Glomus versiforme]
MGKGEGGASIGGLITADKYADALNINPEGGRQQNDDKPEKEAQTDRKKKSTGRKGQDFVLDPSIFYASTVDFSYDFWEFANRCVANPFMIRFEHSEVLYNNLANNNNKSPIQNIQCRFSAFKQCIKVGKWQGDVDLMYDINNTLTNALGAGTFFYDDLEEIFKPWRPKYKGLQSFTHGDTFNSGTVPGQEDVEYVPGEEKKEKDREIPANSATWVCSMIGAPNWGATRITEHSSRGYKWYGSSGHMGIFPMNDPNKDYFSELCADDMNANSTNGGMTASTSTGWDLKSGLSFEKDYDIPRGKYNIYWHCKGLQAFPDEGKEINGFTLILGDATTNLITWLKESTDGTYNRRFVIEGIVAEREKEYKEREFEEPEWTDDNTQFNSNIGETDPEQAEKLKEFDQELEEKDWEDKETDIKESQGEAEREFEKEKEREAEREKEQEKERELERELEREKEREREQEKETEKEKQRERELQAEKEKKQRDQQWEKDKKERDRKEREARVREKEKARREQKEKQKQKDKERKERE